MLADGITRVVALCLAPHNSRTSVGLYRRAVEAAAQGSLDLDFIESWHDEPQLITAFAEKLRAALPSEPCTVLFTAHSVPCRTINSAQGVGDPYSEQAKHTAELVAQAAGLKPSDWAFAFQSQGMTGEPWIGPTVESTLDSLAAAGTKRVVVQPIGFVCDHVEVLYDIDIAFKQYAAERGLTLSRTESLNDSSAFIAALTNVARARLAAAVAP
jgi:ferrochelatase